MTTTFLPRTSELDMLADAIHEGELAGEPAEFLDKLRATRERYAARRDRATSTIPQQRELPTGGDGTGRGRACGYDNTPTEPMRRYLDFLLDTRIADPAERDNIRNAVKDNKREMSFKIGVLEKMPALPKPKPCPVTAARTATSAAPHVYALPDCSYGVVHDDGVLRFYRVNTGKKGKWKGVQFLDMYVSDDRYPVRGNRRDEVMKLIMQDIRGAAKLYAEEYKHCAKCHKGLTDNVSLEIGIGPDCLKKYF